MVTAVKRMKTCELERQKSDPYFTAMMAGHDVGSARQTPQTGCAEMEMVGAIRSTQDRRLETKGREKKAQKKKKQKKTPTEDGSTFYYNSRT